MVSAARGRPLYLAWVAWWWAPASARSGAPPLCARAHACAAVAASTLFDSALLGPTRLCRYQPMVALRLIVRSAKSRFTLFNSSRAIMGGGDWWWHGEGAWNCPYASVRATMASDQKRSAAFGAARAAVPEVFPGGNLLFLDGNAWPLGAGALLCMHACTWLHPLHVASPNAQRPTPNAPRPPTPDPRPLTPDS